MNRVELIKSDLKLELNKEFEVTEIDKKIYAREQGNPTCYIWHTDTYTVMKHHEGNKPVIDNCMSTKEMVNFITKDYKLN